MPLNQEWTYTIPDNIFVDGNADQLKITVSGIPGWLSYDTDTKIFLGTPTTDATFEISVKADDSWYGIVYEKFLLVCGKGGPNSPPTAGVQIPDQTGYFLKQFTYLIPEDTFTDPDGDPLVYQSTLTSGELLPEWL